MSKFDSFFEAPADATLNKKILANLQGELELNRSFHKRRRFFYFLAPALAGLAAFFVFKFTLRNSANELEGAEHMELISELMDDDDTLEIVDDLALLEDMDYLDDEELEG